MIIEKIKKLTILPCKSNDHEIPSLVVAYSYGVADGFGFSFRGVGIGMV